MATATQTPEREDQTIIEFDVRTDEMLVNMGPQHPSTHGVLRLVLRTDGEVISEVTPHLGYLHRCAEKIGENVTPIQFIPYTDRMDYLAGMNMNLGYSLAVEKLCGMKIPEKAQVIRVIIAEMNRIASHLVGMGAYGLDLGTFSPFLYAFREREMILDLFEEVCGARLTYSYHHHRRRPRRSAGRLGGALPEVPRLSQAAHRRVSHSADAQRTSSSSAPPTSASCPRNRPWPTAAPGRCCAARSTARRATPPGTCARSSPIAATRQYDFKAVIPPFPGWKPPEAVIGDCWHRFYVRMLEVIESIKIVEQGLQTLRRPLRARIASSCRGICRPAKPMSRPNARADRWASMSSAARPRTWSPSGCGRARRASRNLSVTNDICRGCLIADVPAIVGSIDIVMGEIDR